MEPQQTNDLPLLDTASPTVIPIIATNALSYPLQPLNTEAIMAILRQKELEIQTLKSYIQSQEAKTAEVKTNIPTQSMHPHEFEDALCLPKAEGNEEEVETTALARWLLGKRDGEGHVLTERQHTYDGEQVDVAKEIEALKENVLAQIRYGEQRREQMYKELVKIKEALDESGAQSARLMKEKLGQLDKIRERFRGQQSNLSLTKVDRAGYRNHCGWLIRRVNYNIASSTLFDV